MWGPGVAAHVDGDRFVGLAKFQRVGDQILEQLRQLPGVAHHHRQRIDRDARAGLLDRDREVRERDLNDRVAAGRFQFAPLRADL